MELELDSSSDFSSGAVISEQYSIDHSTQIIRTYLAAIPPRGHQPGGYFALQYSGSLSDPINAQASADDVRIALEGLPGIETVRVKRGLSYMTIPNICVDVASGSSLVSCSSACAPCDFSGEGVSAGQLIRLEGEWFRVHTAYDGVQESFDLATVQDSSIKKSYVGDTSLNGEGVQAWAGGYEWTVDLLRTSSSEATTPLSSPPHQMLPRAMSIDITSKNCDRCLYVSGLSPGVQYHIRGRANNANGWSGYGSDLASGTPRAIPSAPTHVVVSAVSGECLEVSFNAPLYGEPISSYIVQWDFDRDFVNAEDPSASCSSSRYGSCQSPHSPPSIHLVCGLLASEQYHVRLAARNDIEVQNIYPSGSPRDNTVWSSLVTATPEDQVPDPPTSLDAASLGHDSMQLLFEWPVRDGGREISEFVVAYDTTDDFSSAVEVEIPASIPLLLPNSGGKYVLDLTPSSPPLVSGSMYHVRISAQNEVGTGTASFPTTVIPSGPPRPPFAASLATLSISQSEPVTTATVSWVPPLFDGGYPIDGYFVEWWSKDVISEIQIIRLTYTIPLVDSTFTLSFSPGPAVKKETSNLPWNASADLVRRAILNLGWDENDDLFLVSDIEVSRTALANGFQWTVTFGQNGDQVTKTMAIK